MAYPVIFVHGIGARASVWKKFRLPGQPAFYLSFSNRFAGPTEQAEELGKFIRNVLRRSRQKKVILVCHSMGGLVAREYLTQQPIRHGVKKLILLSAPNLGARGLAFSWVPLLLIMAGLLLSSMILISLGLGWEVTSYFRGVLLHSPAAEAMRPGSKFLKALNARPMPTDVEYVAILSNTRAWPHLLVNILLFREGGDGAVSLSSQKLSLASVPNFSQLKYFESRVAIPHFALPCQAGPAILQALRS